MYEALQFKIIPGPIVA